MWADSDIICHGRTQKNTKIFKRENLSKYLDNNDSGSSVRCIIAVHEITGRYSENNHESIMEAGKTLQWEQTCPSMKMENDPNT